jgi:hypothetical protein
MDDLKTTLSADGAGQFELGVMLGSRKAFASVAGRCSAAEAECIRRIRDGKLYLNRSATWEEFCPEYLGLSKTQANRLIRYLEEFGPDYFEVTQMTRITPEQYRTIAPAIREKSIHVNGEAIALIPENSERVVAAVAELRQAAAPADPPPVPVEERVDAIERRFDHLLADFEELSAFPLSPVERGRMGAVLGKALCEFQRLRLGRR